MTDTPFPEFLHALRRGESQAAAEWERRFVPYLRRLASRRLTTSGLRPASDSVDLCQVVLLKVLVALQAGRYLDVQTAEDFRKLLTRIAQNALHDVQSKEGRARGARAAGGTRLPRPQDMDAIDPGSSPSQHVAREELVRRFCDGLTPELRRVRDWRRAGWTWGQIGQALGKAANTVRIRYRRECNRAAQELGLGESEDLGGPTP
jgi:DNA-directed RNA polymerase specialized sigma24 family protein